MFDILKGYTTDHFFFRRTDNLIQMCNAPTDRSGVYLVYVLAKGRIELVYIGRSGKRGADGKIRIRKAGCGGINDGIVNGKNFNRVARRHSWPSKKRLEGIEALNVYWYATYDDRNQDYPEDVERELPQLHAHIYGRMPRWNRV